MSEYRRWQIAGGTYFFTVVTYGRQRFLTDTLSRQCLRTALRRVRSRLPFKVIAVVLLPDHLHTVWELPRGDAGYGTRWRQIKTLFTSSYQPHMAATRRLSMSRKKRNEQGVWQRRFYEHTCRDEQDLKRCVDYIHANPVKHELVTQACDWPWSSFHRYVRLGEYENDWGGTELAGDSFPGAE